MRVSPEPNFINENMGFRGQEPELGREPSVSTGFWISQPCFLDALEQLPMPRNFILLHKGELSAA